MKYLHKNCFVGTTAVGFLVSSGEAPSRSKAIALGQLLMDKGYVRHVNDQKSFKDTNM
jgi:hypothetical protein